jgi:hypothetical protein
MYSVPVEKLEFPKENHVEKRSHSSCRRALAVIQLISAALESTYLPGRFYSLSHHSRLLQAAGASETSVYFWTDDHISIAMFLLRIIVLLLFAAILWNCRPWVEQLLCPSNPD